LPSDLHCTIAPGLAGIGANPPHVNEASDGKSNTIQNFPLCSTLLGLDCTAKNAYFPFSFLY